MTNSFLYRASSQPVQSVGNQSDKDKLWDSAYQSLEKELKEESKQMTVSAIADFLYSYVVDSMNFSRAYGNNKKAAVVDAVKLAKKYLSKSK